MPNTTHTGQSMHVFGEQNVIVHVAGDGNSVVLGRPHLRLTRDLIRRQVGRGAAGEPDPTVAGEREADVLLPHSLAIPFCGRVAERKRLEAWLDSPARISAHVLIGPGGRGKTRLALEICEARASAGVRAGFVTPREFVRFRGQANLAE